MALTKLKIQACKDPACKQKDGSPFTVMFNPEKYTREYKIDLKSVETIGGENKRIFWGMQPETLKFEFVFDATGVVEAPTGLKGKSVPKMLDTFRKMVFKINGQTHRTPFLQLSWGTLVFNSQMETYKEEYTLFKEDGTPIRAKIIAEFIGASDEEETKKRIKLSSPDMTHTITVSAGDTLPALCYKIYKDISVYQQIARHNKLDTFTFLKPGTTLQFPPLKQ
ncbi:MAG: hypothetical protein R8G66_20425 [Cytophagales bacterium]|nr:hypothetical protein [Cytophagales bacterium]